MDYLKMKDGIAFVAEGKEGESLVQMKRGKRVFVFHVATLVLAGQIEAIDGDQGYVIVKAWDADEYIFRLGQSEYKMLGIYPPAIWRISNNKYADEFALDIDGSPPWLVIPDPMDQEKIPKWLIDPSSVEVEI